MTDIVTDEAVEAAAIARNFPPDRPPKYRLCEECGLNPADLPSRICVGCHAYLDHTA